MTLQCIRNANRDVSNDKPDPLQDCRDVVHIAIFFDGTGNNRFADDATKSWSNVARLYFAARDEKNNGIYRIYIAGVGTRYNASRNWAERIDSWVEDKTLGNAGGLGGERRLQGGHTQVNDALERALLNNARQEGGRVKKTAERMQGEGFEKMFASLANHRLVKAIHFSIFGFSRGAALARAFSNRLAEQMESQGANQYKFQGVDASIAFLGVFDTVASFGLPGTNWGGWEGKDLTVPPHVEMCHHYVAPHEVRFSFPLDLVRDRGQTHGHVEKVYAGVHSDVGGGYEPDKQGRKDTLARIPLHDMLGAAIEGGSRLHGLEHLRTTNFPVAQRLIVDNDTKAAYQAYLRYCGAGGTVEAQFQRHMALYYAYRGTQHRAKVGTSTANEERLRRLRQRVAASRDAESKAESHKWREFAVGTVPSWWDARNKEGQLETQLSADEAALEAAELDAQRLAASDSDIAIQAYALQRAIEKGESLVAHNGTLILVLEKHQWMLDAWRTNVGSEVTSFFDNYVHDSRTDFLGGNEPFVYFRNRGIHEQARQRAGASGSW
jgi:Uncharacterized alpha/beta hydrolase domain (DUF2235)